MKLAKQPKILFFSAGRIPTAKEKLESIELGIPVQWRNGAAHAEGEFEPCDGVAGTPPLEYKKRKVKTAKQVVEAYKKQLAAAMAGEEVAPTVAVNLDLDDDKDNESGVKDGGVWGAGVKS